MKTRTAAVVVNRLNKAFPDIKGLKKISETKIFLGDVAEGFEIDNLPACDYYTNLEGSHYTYGVHNKLWNLVVDCGWFVECYDPGTYYAFPVYG